MSDISQESFVETDNHQSVIYQQGRDVQDYELNEAESILRVLIYRMGEAVGDEGVKNGIRVVSTGSANGIRIATGSFVAAGYRKNLSSVVDVTGLTTPGGERTDLVYARLRETVVNDPHPITGIGVLSQRKVLTVTFAVAQGVAVPTSTGYPWTGGDYYYTLASIARHSGQATILNADITQLYELLPDASLAEMCVYLNGYVDRLVAGRASIVETSSTNPGALTLDMAPNTADTGHFLRIRYGRDHAEEVVHTIGRDSKVVFDAPAGVKRPLTLQDSVGAVDIPWSDDSAGSEQDAGRKLYDGLGRLVTVAADTSLLRAVNGRAMASIGNGTTTFGDFNGSAALVNVVAAALAIPATSLHLYVKQGTYVIPSTLTATGLDLVLEGADESECILQNTSAAATGIVTTSRLSIKRMTFTRTSTATKAITAGNLTLEEVTVTGMSVNLLGGTGNRVWDRCTLSGSGRLVDLGAGSAVGSLLIRDSRLTSTGTGVPLIYSVTTGGGIGAVTLERCYGIVAIGTDSSAESGIVDVESTFTQTSAGARTLLKFRFIECTFEGSGTPACFQVGVRVLPYMEFSGCTFTHTVRNLAATSLPVFHPRAVNLLIRDCYFDLQNVCSAFGGGTVGGALDFLAVEKLVVRNLSVNKTVAQMFDDTVVSTGGLAVVYMIAGQHVDVDGMSFRFQGGTALTSTIPRQVVYVESDGGTGTRSAILKNIRHETFSGEGTGPICSQAYIRVAGQYKSGVTVSDCSLHIATDSRMPYTTAAIMVGGTGTDTLKTGYPALITNCSISEVAGYGIHDSNSGTGVVEIRSCNTYHAGNYVSASHVNNRFGIYCAALAGHSHVTGCRVVSSAAQGMYFQSAYYSIIDNYVQDCALSSLDLIYVTTAVAIVETSVDCTGNKMVATIDPTSYPYITYPNPSSLSGLRYRGFDTTADTGGTPTVSFEEYGHTRNMRFNRAKLYNL